MKATLLVPPPRNPFVVLARQRRAGSHRPSGASLRRRAARDLRRELDRIDSPMP